MKCTVVRMLLGSSRTIRNDMKDLNRALEDILYDPQTSGGLMIAVSENDAKNLLEDLQNTIPCAKIIGYIEEKEEKSIILEERTDRKNVKTWFFLSDFRQALFLIENNDRRKR